VRALEEADDFAVLGVSGHPIPEFRHEPGATALMTAWSRSAMARSASGISAIFASTTLSPSAFGPGRAVDLSSFARSFIAARSSSVNRSGVVPFAVVLVSGFCESFMAGSFLHNLWRRP
jgi:hypothetical protein